MNAVEAVNIAIAYIRELRQQRVGSTRFEISG
jgi:hypothetical protein